MNDYSADSKAKDNGNLVQIRARVPLKTLIERVEADPKAPAPASNYDGRFKTSGDLLRMRCPFHREKTPSFTLYVNPSDSSNDRYACFGGACGAKGNIFDYVQRRFGLEKLGESLRWIGDNFPETKSLMNGRRNNGYEKRIEREACEFAPESAEAKVVLKILADAQEYFVNELIENSGVEARMARGYLERKGMTPLIGKLGIGFAPGNDLLLKNLIEKYKKDSADVFGLLVKSGLVGSHGFSIFSRRITFPITTLDGKIIGYSARVTVPDQKERKYKNSSRSLVYDKNNVLMGLGQLDIAQVASEGAFVVEGITDNFGFFKQQLNCSLALGSASLSAGQIGLIRAFNPSRLVLVTDGDIPGVQAAVRDSNKALSYPANYVQLPVFVLPLPEGKDPFDVFYTEGVDIRKYAAKNMLTPKQFLLNHLEFMASAVDSTNRREFEMFLNNETYHIIDDDELVRAAEKHGLKIAAKRKRSIITSPEPAVSFFLGEEFSKRAKAKLRKELPF